MATPSRVPTSDSGVDRRRFTRYNMALDVSFGPAVASTASARPADAQLERTVTVNISLGGLCFYSDILYPLGTPLYCAITLPDVPAPLEAVGPVAWFQKVDQDAHAYKLGVEFADVSAQATAVLQRFLDTPPPAAVCAASRRLLLVDDDDELRHAVQLRFESAGFEVITAGDGLEALRLGREGRPSLIILDLMLPNLNGYEVCRLLKFDQKFHHIPIILCSARSRRDDMAMGEAAGADAYVTKPFDGKALIHQVETLLAEKAHG